jgi:hypothetical protein
MKNIRYFILLIPAMATWSCGKDVVYDLPDSERYDNLYLLQAVDLPRQTDIFMLEDSVQTTQYSAFWSGVEAPKDINVTFEVDMDLVAAYNEENITSYAVMPEGSYELEATSAVIPAGRSRTPLMDIRLKALGHLELYKEYLLPLVMKTDDVKVNESLSVIYYKVAASYAPGNVPRAEVGRNVVNAMEFFAYNDKCLFTRSEDGKLRRYGWDPIEETFGGETVIKSDWTTANVRLISAGGGNTFQVVNQYDTWIVLPATEDGTAVNDPSAYSAIITGGCNIFDRSVWNAHPTGFVARWGGSGNMQYYPMSSDWQALGGGGVTTVFNFGIYRILFVNDDDLIGIDINGDMWIHEFSSNTFSSPKKTGSGWEDYTHVTSFGKDLIARDADGKLWLYDFDIRGFLALK